MNKNKITRRRFITTASVGAIGAVATARFGSYGRVAKKATALAINGGQPVRTKPFPSWPIWDKTDEKSLLDALNSGIWNRYGKTVTNFEKQFAEMMGAKYCLGTQSGTQALHTCLSSLDIGGGDEVIVPVYTFVATIDSILLCNALPVFCDIDPETYQIDHRIIEKKITENTKAILTVDILGASVHQDKIQEIAKKHNLKVVEDACQAHLAEWNGKKLGNFGEAGCFSFSAPKNVNCGEGGALITDNKELLDRCSSFHNFGRAEAGLTLSGYVRMGTKYRMTAFQAAILLSQMTRAKEQANLRTENAAYLTSRLKSIPGIIPQKTYEGNNRHAYHMYAFRYKKEQFNNVPRNRFLRALTAEGIPNYAGYSEILNKEPFVENTLNSKTYQKIYPPERLKWYRENIECPENDKLTKESVWLFQERLITTKKDMDDIADAIQKIYENKDKLTT